MADKNAGTDIRGKLEKRVEKASSIFEKHKEKGGADDHRRIARKRLKRAQRRLQKLSFAEKKAAEGKKDDASS